MPSTRCCANIPPNVWLFDSRTQCSQHARCLCSGLVYHYTIRRQNWDQIDVENFRRNWGNTSQTRTERVTSAFFHCGLECMLGRPLLSFAAIPLPERPIPRDSTGRRHITGTCVDCYSGAVKRRRLTRKTCSFCSRPIYDQHCVTYEQCFTWSAGKHSWNLRTILNFWT